MRVFRRFSPDPDDEKYDDYCRTKILLRHPFRDIETLPKENRSCTELYATCQEHHTHPRDTFRIRNDEPPEQEDDDEDVIADMLDMTEADWQPYA